MKKEKLDTTSTQTFLFGVDTNFQPHMLLLTNRMRIGAVQFEERHILDEVKHLSTNSTPLAPNNLPDIGDHDIMLYLSGSPSSNMKTVLKKNHMETKKFIKFINFTVVSDGEALKDFSYIVYDKGLMFQRLSAKEINIKEDLFEVITTLLNHYLEEEIQKEVNKISNNLKDDINK